MPAKLLWCQHHLKLCRDKYVQAVGSTSRALQYGVLFWGLEVWGADKAEGKQWRREHEAWQPRTGGKNAQVLGESRAHLLEVCGRVDSCSVAGSADLLDLLWMAAQSQYVGTKGQM